MIEPGEIPEREMERDRKGENGEEITEEGFDKYLERMARETIKWTGSSPEVKNAQKTVNELTETIDESDRDIVLRDLRDSSYNGPTEKDQAYRDFHKNEDLEAAKKEAEHQREDEIGLVDRSLRFFARAKGLTLLFGIASSISFVGTFAVALAALVKSMNDGSPDPDLNLTPEQKENLKQLIKHWWEKSDAQLWDEMATFCDQFNPSLQAQVLMMDQIKELSQALKSPFLWENEDDEWKAIQAVVNAYATFIPTTKQSKSRALYTAIKGYTYQQSGASAAAALPRQIAANIVEMALYQIIRIPTQPLKVLGEK